MMKPTVPYIHIMEGQKRTTKQKLASKIGQNTMLVAKDRNDPLFEKLRKAQSLVKKYKEMIKAKYGSAGKSAAMKS